jgi:hypothetical protein
MWYFDGQIIKTPKTMVINDITHPPGIFRDSDTLTSLGIKLYSEVTPDFRYYTNGAYTVDTSGAEVVGTYAGVAKDVATLKAGMLDVINSQVSSKQGDIDWYWTRADKGGTAVPSNIKTYATTIYSEQSTKEGEVAALDTLDKIKEYENRPHTEIRKDEVLYTSSDSETQGESPTKSVGDFKEYHASDTTSSARSINMLDHWTANPTDEVDPAFVSLTAD